MDGTAFDAYVRTQLAPCLRAGDVVFLDNLNVHKSPRAAKALAERGAWLFVGLRSLRPRSSSLLPKYSPDLNPIEMAFAKLKALLRKAAERTVDGLWRAIGRIIDLFEPTECANYFSACGYDPD